MKLPYANYANSSINIYGLRNWVCSEIANRRKRIGMDSCSIPADVKALAGMRCRSQQRHAWLR